MVRTNWSRDPFAGGSYSAMTVGATPADRTTLATPLGDRVFFAGEHTDTAHPATVHGAMSSGRRAAGEVDGVAAPGETVIVVGAGAAGATAAAELAALGYRVTVLEARDRTGGRLHTVSPRGWGAPVETGASWVHDTAASDLADRLASADIDTVRWNWDDRVPEPTGRRDRLAAVVDAAVSASDEAADDAISLGDAIRRLTPDVDAGELDQYLQTEIATELGADPDELSARWALSEGSEGPDLLVTGGYDGVIGPLVVDVEVLVSTPVRGVVTEAGSVIVVDADGTGRRADRVVVTVPLGVLRRGALTFDPGLPDPHRQALERLGVGLLDKFWFRFEERWWDETATIWDASELVPGPFREWYNLEPVTGQPILLALLGGSTARDWASRGDRSVRDEALRTLRVLADSGW